MVAVAPSLQRLLPSARLFLYSTPLPPVLGERKERRGAEPLCTPYILSFPHRRESRRGVNRGKRNPAVECGAGLDLTRVPIGMDDLPEPLAPNALSPSLRKRDSRELRMQTPLRGVGFAPLDASHTLITAQAGIQARL